MKHVLSVIFFLIVQIVFLFAPQVQDLNDLRIHHDLKVTLYPQLRCNHNSGKNITNGSCQVK